jgi:hypothetical protein
MSSLALASMAVIKPISPLKTSFSQLFSVLLVVLREIPVRLPGSSGR